MVPNQRSQEPARSARALTRRSLFEFAGLALLSAALPSDATLARPPSEQDQPPSSPATSPIMEKLSSYMSQAGTRPLPEEVVEKAKHHILDTFAAMTSGSELPPGRAALQFAQEGPALILIRIDTKAGHGAGKPTSKLIDEAADRWAFLQRALNMAGH